TAHIIGLVHESRAVKAWREYLSTHDERLLTRARGSETDALEFFRNVRDATPMREHGYESEARYYRKKFEVFENRDATGELAEEPRTKLYHGLYLLRTSEGRVPRADQKESPKTKALLLKRAGDIDAALETLISERAAITDPVRKLRLTRAALTLAME